MKNKMNSLNTTKKNPRTEARLAPLLYSWNLSINHYHPSGKSSELSSQTSIIAPLSETITFLVNESS